MNIVYNFTNTIDKETICISWFSLEKVPYLIDWGRKNILHR